MFAASTFAGLDDDEGVDEEERKDEDDDVGQIAFSGKKKKSSKSSKKSGVSFSAALLDKGNNDDEPTKVADEDEPVISFTGKKKSSKKKSNSAFASLGGESGLGSDVTDAVEPEQQSMGTSYVESNDSKVSKKEEVAETSKSKKKKKKSGRTAQEEDDLDKILAELGETPAMVKPTTTPPQEEEVQVQPHVLAESAQPADAADEKEGEEEKEESAAAKKKKKKKKAKQAQTAGTRRNCRRPLSGSGSRPTRGPPATDRRPRGLPPIPPPTIARRLRATLARRLVSRRHRPGSPTRFTCTASRGPAPAAPCSWPGLRSSSPSVPAGRRRGPAWRPARA